MKPTTYKNYFLWSLIVGLSISSLIGIYIFLFNEFGKTETQLLLTTLAIGGFSLAGLCCSTIHNLDNFKLFSYIGMLNAITGFIICFCVVWEIFDLENIWKLMVVFIILSVTFSHISLLLLVKPKSTIIKNILRTTIIFITINAFMLILITTAENEFGELFYRLLGVFSIIGVVGTIVTQILNKIKVNSK